MLNIYKINAELDIPIYKQLVDSVCVAIKKGELAEGTQLPTVQALTQKLGIARGTVKRAYDELERLGFVEKAQGRGTFISYRANQSGSRKEDAMSAIDAVLDLLENMGFSPSEINIFLNLKLRERAEQETLVKVAVIECNPENLSQMSEQLRHIPGVDLYSYLLENIRQYPYTLGDDFDLIITTATHVAYIESVAPAKKKVVRIALRPSATSLAQIIKLRPGKKLGIIGHSLRFAQLLEETCRSYTEGVEIFPPVVAESAEQIAAYLQDKEVILIPATYEKHFGQNILTVLQKFRGISIDCCYEMDEGSLLYLETKIGRLLEEKRL